MSIAAPINCPTTYAHRLKVSCCLGMFACRLCVDCWGMKSPYECWKNRPSDRMMVARSEMKAVPSIRSDNFARVKLEVEIS